MENRLTEQDLKMHLGTKLKIMGLSEHDSKEPFIDKTKPFKHGK